MIFFFFDSNDKIICISLTWLTDMDENDRKLHDTNLENVSVCLRYGGNWKHPNLLFSAIIWPKHQMQTFFNDKTTLKSK